MLSDLSPDARVLADRMSEISEETWCAGWMHDLEFTLWAALCGATAEGRLKLTSDQVADPKALSSACHGWIVFRDDIEETYLPLPEWDRRFAVWSSRSDSDRAEPFRET
jgi:hypothetical protein